LIQVYCTNISAVAEEVQTSHNGKRDGNF